MTISSSIWHGRCPSWRSSNSASVPVQPQLGVTTKGLTALSCYCPNLSSLCIHFQAATLGLSEVPRAAPQNRPSAFREECALTHLIVGNIHLPEESALLAAQVLLRVFPRLNHIGYFDQSWKKVVDTFAISGRLVDRLGKKPSFTTPLSSIDIPSQKPRLRALFNREIPTTVRAYRFGLIPTHFLPCTFVPSRLSKGGDSRSRPMVGKVPIGMPIEWYKSGVTRGALTSCWSPSATWL